MLAATFAVCHFLHSSLHPAAGKGEHFCLVCSLVKGQVTPVEPSLVFVAAFVFVLFSVRLDEGASPVFFEYRFTPTRAPPTS